MYNNSNSKFTTQDVYLANPKPVLRLILSDDGLLKLITIYSLMKTRHD